MRIIHEDNNKLLFKLYPETFYTFGLFFIIAVFAYGLINFSRNSYEILINASLLGLFVVHAIITFLYPLTVKIDKSTDTLTYFYLSLFTYIFPSKIKRIFRNNPTLTIKISHLKRIEVKNIFDGILKPTFSNVFSYLDTEGDICIQFITDNTEPINFAPGLFFYTTHRKACIKIANYLKIPFIDSYKPYKDVPK